MKKTKKNIIYLILAIDIIFIISSIDSTIVGVSPPEIYFNNVLRNGYSVRTMVISIDSPEPITVEIKTRGEISDWLNFSDRIFNVSKDKPYQLRVSVTPPSDTPSGNYSGFLSIVTGGFGQGLEGQAVGIIRSAVEPFINVGVVDTEIIDCSASKFSVESVEKGDEIVFKLRVSNKGNIRMKPKINIDVWDQDQISIIKNQDFQKQEILPTVEDEFVLRMNSGDLEIGQYFVEITVPECYSSETLTFDVLEPGALKSSGILTSILVPKTVNVYETTQIIANFKNNGEKEVSSQFKGKVSREGKIIQILESEKVSVPVDSLDEFNFYFTPKETGKYVVSGRVYYSNKKTFELSSSFDVIGKKNYFSFFIYLVYGVLIFLIVILFYKINKERRSYSSKLKNLKLKI
jgi:hypothetical protein